MSVKYASGRTLASAPLVSTAAYPPTLDATALRGSWVIAPDGTMVYSDGSEWYANEPQGSEVLIPPWVPVPDGWFEVDITLGGVLSNRKLISNKFNISYVLSDAETWPIVTPSAMYSDAAGTTPVLTAPEPVGLLESSVTPQLNFFQDVAIDRPTWIELTRTIGGVEKTVDAINFDNLGKEFKVDFPTTVNGSMVHFTSAGPYILGVEIPAGEYKFGSFHGWADVEELVVLDRFLTSGEANELISELGKQRDRLTELNLPTDLSSAFRDRTEIRSMPSFDFTGVTEMTETFRNSAAPEWLSGSFLDTAVDVTSFFRTFRSNSLTSIPDGLFNNTSNVTSFSRTFRDNSLTSISAGLFDNTPNVTSFYQTFRDNSLTSIPTGLFDNTPNVTSFGWTFLDNSLTSIPDGLFNNTPNVISFSRTFRDNNLNSIPDKLFDNTPNVTNFSFTFLGNSLTSIPAGLFDNTPNVTDFQETFRVNSLTSIPAGLFDNTPNVTDFRGTFQSNSLTSAPANLFDTQTVATNYDRCFEENDIGATGVDNILVSVLKSADDNNLSNGRIDIDGGTNATPTATGQSAADALRARGWTVNLNGY